MSHSMLQYSGIVHRVIELSSIKHSCHNFKNAMKDMKMYQNEGQMTGISQQNEGHAQKRLAL